MLQCMLFHVAKYIKSIYFRFQFLRSRNFCSGSDLKNLSLDDILLYLVPNSIFSHGLQWSRFFFPPSDISVSLYQCRNE